MGPRGIRRDPLLDSADRRGRPPEPPEDKSRQEEKEPPRMTDDRERWALILGGSSGMGEATAITLAKAGYNICGIHLDFRAALAHVDEVKAAIEAAGCEALYIGMNAADDDKRAAALENPARGLRPISCRGSRPVRPCGDALAGVRVPRAVPHRGPEGRRSSSTRGRSPRPTMANSLVYWVQDLWRGGFLGQGSKIYAMTSEGSTRVVPSYGGRVVG